MTHEQAKNCLYLTWRTSAQWWMSHASSLRNEAMKAYPASTRYVQFGGTCDWLKLPLELAWIWRINYVGKYGHIRHILSPLTVTLQSLQDRPDLLMTVLQIHKLSDTGTAGYRKFWGSQSLLSSFSTLGRKKNGFTSVPPATRGITNQPAMSATHQHGQKNGIYRTPGLFGCLLRCQPHSSSCQLLVGSATKNSLNTMGMY